MDNEAYIKVINLTSVPIHVEVRSGLKSYDNYFPDEPCRPLPGNDKTHFVVPLGYEYVVCVNPGEVREWARRGVMCSSVPGNERTSDGRHAILTWDGNCIGSYKGHQYGRFLNHCDGCRCNECTSPGNCGNCGSSNSRRCCKQAGKAVDLRLTPIVVHTNAAGVPMMSGTREDVREGRNRDIDGRFDLNFYCSRVLGMELRHADDHRCGPSDGPQCSDCEKASRAIPRRVSLGDYVRLKGYFHADSVWELVGDDCEVDDKGEMGYAPPCTMQQNAGDCDGL
jgi:hypothetical protein